MVGRFTPRPLHRRGVRCTRWRFRLLVQAACQDLPGFVRRRLHNVAVTVEDVPTADIAAGGAPLGYYQGTPIGYRGPSYTMAMPDKITVYRQPLLAVCSSQAELREEVRLTVLHEIGHFFGISDEELPF